MREARGLSTVRAHPQRIGPTSQPSASQRTPWIDSGSFAALSLRLLVCLTALACAPFPRPAAQAGDAVVPSQVEASQPAPVRAPSPRGLWVLAEGSQRVLEHPDRLDELLDDARALGVTDLFVQVYRGGRAWFPTERADDAPYQAVWRTGGGGAPERDALEVLLERAHAEGLRVHAWVNVLSLARNTEAPIVATLGRSAVLVDQYGRSLLDYPDQEVPEPQAGFYRMGTPAVYLDPAAPGVAAHLATTFEDLLLRYPAFDGLHLDYIRYPDVLPFTPGTRFGVGLSFGHGEATRQRFQEATGLTAPFQDSLGNGNAFDDWRRDELSALVARIGQQARAARPGLVLSAAVWAYPDRAYLAIFQDWRGWLERDLLDVAIPMLYSKDDRLFGYAVDAFAGSPAADRIWVGLGSWLFARDPGRAVAQLGRVPAPLGTALFSWDSIHAEPALRDALAQAVASPGLPASQGGEPAERSGGIHVLPVAP